MKTKNLFSFLTIMLIPLFFLSSCTKHSCVGEWNGGYTIGRRSSATAKLNIKNDGSFSLRIVQPFEEVNFYGEWESLDDNKICLNATLCSVYENNSFSKKVLGNLATFDFDNNGNLKRVDARETGILTREI